MLRCLEFLLFPKFGCLRPSDRRVKVYCVVGDKCPHGLAVSTQTCQTYGLLNLVILQEQRFVDSSYVVFPTGSPDSIPYLINQQLSEYQILGSFYLKGHLLNYLVDRSSRKKVVPIENISLNDTKIIV